MDYVRLRCRCRDIPLERIPCSLYELLHSYVICTYDTNRPCSAGSAEVSMNAEARRFLVDAIFTSKHPPELAYYDYASAQPTFIIYRPQRLPLGICVGNK